MNSRRFDNPFRQYRAEQFSENLWSYYVPTPFVDQIGARPLIIEGGRGSGKSMFFLCNSWRERRLALASNGRTIVDLISGANFVGLYYRVDGPFVSALSGTDLPDAKWNGVFATYLSVCVVRELFAFLSECEAAAIVTFAQLRPVVERASDLLALQPLPRTMDDLTRALLRVLDRVEAAANDPGKLPDVPLTMPGRLMNEVTTALRALPHFSTLRVQVFIDEYETLLEYQQRQINSLIKQSAAHLVYNAGFRPKGMKTPKTMVDSEVIEPPHDFRLIRPEALLSPDDGSGLQTFRDILRQICRKRFENSRTLGDGVDSRWLDIESYLGHFPIDAELQSLDASPSSPAVLEDLRRLIASDVSEPIEAERLYRLLGPDASTSCARLHLCLLRRKQYRPAPSELAMEYAAWLSDPAASKRYSDWWHNTKFGLAVLLSKEQRRDKWYAGFDVYALLSSGIIRYFIELCEHAFDSAHENQFDWGVPRALTQEEQSRAARHVSRYKIRDIERYDPDGAALRQMVLSLGTVFSALQKDALTTLGEPEVNHFSSSTTGIGEPRVASLLRAAVLWTVLQERPPTKEKEPDVKIDPVNYHLNHIYCPHFGISYRQKRKIDIRSDELAAISGISETPDSRAGSTSTDDIRVAVRALLLRNKIVTDAELPNDLPSAQLDLL